MVVEDEFFQAKDLTQAFSAAGARLVGPFPSLSAAVDALGWSRAGMTVVDEHSDKGINTLLVVDAQDVLCGALNTNDLMRAKVI